MKFLVDANNLYLLEILDKLRDVDPNTFAKKDLSNVTQLAIIEKINEYLQENFVKTDLSNLSDTVLKTKILDLINTELFARKDLSNIDDSKLVEKINLLTDSLVFAKKDLSNIDETSLVNKIELLKGNLPFAEKDLSNVQDSDFINKVKTVKDYLPFIQTDLSNLNENSLANKIINSKNLYETTFAYTDLSNVDEGVIANKAVRIEDRDPTTEDAPRYPHEIWFNYQTFNIFIHQLSENGKHKWLALIPKETEKPDTRFLKFDIFEDNSCKALYRFDGNADDDSGLYNGKWIGTELYTTGKHQKAARFLGNSAVDVGYEEFSSVKSISTWINWEKVRGVSNWAVFLSNKVKSSSTDNILAAVYKSKLVTYDRNAKYITPFAIPDREWMHVCVINEGNDKYTYFLDGIPYATVTNSKISTDLKFIGADNAYNTTPNENFTGSIDTTRLFTRKLTKDEVIDLVYEEKGKAASLRNKLTSIESCVSYIPFDDCMADVFHITNFLTGSRYPRRYTDLFGNTWRRFGNNNTYDGLLAYQSTVPLVPPFTITLQVLLITNPYTGSGWSPFIGCDYPGTPSGTTFDWFIGVRYSKFYMNIGTDRHEHVVSTNVVPKTEIPYLVVFRVDTNYQSLTIYDIARKKKLDEVHATLNLTQPVASYIGFGGWVTTSKSLNTVYSGSIAIRNFRLFTSYLSDSEILYLLNAEGV